MENRHGIYAGDAAWREWFAKCAVSRCGAESARRLGGQIRAAMYAQLARFGFSRRDVGDDDPVSVFDAYFMLKGSRDSSKPLKTYFTHRILVEGLRLVDFVCGTLFGSRSGRVHDIAIDWIATSKGWKPRSLRDADGRRRVVWEGAGAEAVAEMEQPDVRDPADLLDIAPIRLDVERMLESVSRKTKVEKPKVALLCHVTAHGIPITETAVIEELGTEKSRAYAIREKVMETLKREMRKTEGGDSPLFGRILLEVVSANVPGHVLAKIGGAA